MLVPTDENKDTRKKYEELQKIIRYLIRSLTNSSDNYDEKFMKIKFDSDDYIMIVVVRSILHESNKYFRQIF